MFEGFSRTQIATSGARIQVAYAGDGPPLLLLHGYPQTMAMWHQLAPQLARHYTVVLADLRGYGDSSKPAGGADYAGYSKRAMARDQLEVMRALGFERFALIGHDRGGRVGHRLALDAPAAVSRLVLLDIVPTYHVYATIDQTMATAYYHWFFFIQPFDLPERLINSDPIYFLHHTLGGWGSALDVFAPAALAEYERCFTPDMIHASCDDYRAGASIDMQHDAADRGRRLECPLLVLWGSRGWVGRQYDPPAVWQDYARDVQGQPIDAGHFLVEERPDETFAALHAFLQAA